MGSPDLLREAGSVRSQPTRSLASGPAADATDGNEEASREGGRRRSRRTPSRFPSGGRGTSTRGGSAPSAARTAATRPPSRRASDRPRSRRRAPPRAAPCRRARGPLRDPRRGAPPSRTPSPRSASTSIAGRGREHLGPGAPARDCGDEAAAGAPRGPRRPVELEVAIAGRRPPRQPPLPHEPADRRVGPGVALLLDEPVAGPPRRMAPPPRSRGGTRRAPRGPILRTGRSRASPSRARAAARATGPPCSRT